MVSFMVEFNFETYVLFNPIALRKTKIVCNFGLSECKRVNKTENLNVFHNSKA